VQITKDFGGIIACRLFIGLPESAFYPGTIYLLTRWYTKKVIMIIHLTAPSLLTYGQELAFRSAILFAGLLISNAFGAVSRYWLPNYFSLTISKLIAAGILANMEGKRGIRAWRW
jgi:hypothetical protein